MEGSIAPLREITEICKKNSVQLLVDEAHAIGILGAEGRGLSFNCRSDITMITGTFGKAFGSGGAFIASNSEIGEYLSKQVVHLGIQPHLRHLWLLGH